MCDEKLKNYRQDKPIDYLHQRLFVNNGKLMHNMFKFPGEYDHPCPNKSLNADGSLSEVDISYKVKLNNNEEMIINVEDETSIINKKTLKKVDRYKTNHKYSSGLCVLSIILTSMPIEKCLKKLECTPTDRMEPIIISYLDYDGEKILSILRNKILNNKVLTKEELVKLILIIRTFDTNQAEILEEICLLIKKAKVDDEKFKMEMVYCSRYIIHKYAKTIDDILRLEGVVGLQYSMTCGSIIEDIKKEGRLEGKIEGRQEGFSEGRLEGKIEGRQEGLSEGISIGKSQGIQEGMDLGRIKGKNEGRDEGSLSVLNALVNDSNNKYTVKELSEKFGFTEEEILNGRK